MTPPKYLAAFETFTKILRAKIYIKNPSEKE
jgi:hypothetical protein